ALVHIAQPGRTNRIALPQPVTMCVAAVGIPQVLQSILCSSKNRCLLTVKPDVSPTYQMSQALQEGASNSRWQGLPPALRKPQEKSSECVAPRTRRAKICCRQFEHVG